MDVTIIGAGHVGRALTAGLQRAGHEVALAVRNPAGRDFPAPTRPLAGAADNADVTVLAVPFDRVGEALDEVRPGERTVLVDATNPFGRAVPGGHPSGAAYVASLLPGVPVVKTFNVVGAERMADPLVAGHRVLMPVAGDDADTRRMVLGLVSDLGFDAVDVGGLAAAQLMEQAARYWGLLALAGGLGREFALVAARATSA